jgi:signal transduction histidine kinase
VTALQLLVLALVAAAVASTGEASSALRHLYLVPVLWAALRSGSAAGGLMGLLAGLLHAPLALAAVERWGLESRTVEGLVALGMPLVFGWVVGRLAEQSRSRGARLEAVLDMQRALRHDAPLEARMAEAAARMREALGVERVGLVIAHGSGEAVWASAPPGAAFDPRSAAGWTLAHGGPVEAEDLARDPRFPEVVGGDSTPRRALVLPLDPGSGPIGALALERAGDLPAATRAAAREMAVHMALAVENAQMLLRQQRFAQELEEKVAAATARLTGIDRAKSEFLAVVSHELRTPLTALVGFSELLLTRDTPPERVRRWLGHLHAEAARLGRMVADLLDLARIEAGRPVELRLESLALDELVERNLEQFAALHAGHRFRWAPCRQGLTLAADRDALDRMLKNLLSNAVKYSPDGGVVEVLAGPSAEHPGMVELVVEDSGIGIPPAEIGRIFEKYVRVAHPATRGVSGLGLGLSLVRALAEAHGGRVEVESLPGKGSRFRLVLPTSEA